MRAAKIQVSLRIRAVSPEPPLLAHTSSESRGTFRQKARSLAPLNGWACAVKICHDPKARRHKFTFCVTIWNFLRCFHFAHFHFILLVIWNSYDQSSEEANRPIIDLTASIACNAICRPVKCPGFSVMTMGNHNIKRRMDYDFAKRRNLFSDHCRRLLYEWINLPQGKKKKRNVLFLETLQTLLFLGLLQMLLTHLRIFLLFLVVIGIGWIFIIDHQFVVND